MHRIPVHVEKAKAGMSLADLLSQLTGQRQSGQRQSVDPQPQQRKRVSFSSDFMQRGRPVTLEETVQSVEVFCSDANNSIPETGVYPFSISHLSRQELSDLLDVFATSGFSCHKGSVDCIPIGTYSLVREEGELFVLTDTDPTFMLIRLRS